MRRILTKLAQRVTGFIARRRAERDWAFILDQLPNIDGRVRPDAPDDWKLRVLRQVGTIDIIDGTVCLGKDPTEIARQLGLLSDGERPQRKRTLQRVIGFLKKRHTYVLRFVLRRRG